MEWPSILFRHSSVIFRCQKYVKKGYMEMRKWIYLVPLKSVLGRSILHYYLKGVKQIKSNNKVNKQIIVNFSQYNTRKRVFKIKNKKNWKERATLLQRDNNTYSQLFGPAMEECYSTITMPPSKFHELLIIVVNAMSEKWKNETWFLYMFLLYF